MRQNSVNCQAETWHLACTGARSFDSLRSLRMTVRWTEKAFGSLSEGVLPFFRALSLDFAEGGCYTQFVRNQGPEASVFWFSCIRIPALQLHTGRMMDSERDRAGAAPKGNAKTLRQKDRIWTTLRKVRAGPHTKGATGSLLAKGNLSGEDGGRRTEGDLPPLFVCAKSLLLEETGFQAPSLRELSSIARLRESSPSPQNTPSVTALAGDAPCHLPHSGRHFGSLSEGAVERSETEGVLPFSAKDSLRHGACVRRSASASLPEGG